jgi:hypothetical protein
MPTRSGGQLERLLGLFLAFVYAGDAIAALNANQARYLTVGVIAAVAFTWHAARTVNR